jgi:dTDP-4-amino-4,6-dideoxygalactose transaminase
MAAMDRISDTARRRNCFVLEDSAQAHGATWKGNPVGHYGDIATYSFFPGKNLGAFGDAGAVLTRDPKRAELAKALSQHGGLKKYEHQYVGYNSRLDTLQAAVLRVKLKHLEKWNEARRSVAKFYSEALQGCGDLKLPKVAPDAKPVFHLYVVEVENRDAFMDHLKAKGVSTGVHYPRALHQLPALSPLFAGQRFPNSERIAAHGVSLPMDPTMTSAEIQLVVDAVKSYFK